MERENDTVELPTENPETFKIYVNWLYFDRFYTTADGDVEVMENGVDGDKEWGRWSACYTLSSFLLDTAFGDALIDMAREKLSSDNAFYLEFAQEVYPASVPGSQHRKFAVHIAIETWSDFSFEGEKKDDFPSEFLTDLIVAMGSKLRTGGARRQTPRELFKDVDTCKYHDHTLKNTPCYLETRKHCP